MRIKVAVCDSDKEVCGYIAEIIVRQRPDVQVKTFYTAEALLQAGDNFDIYFLDIKDINGMETARILRSREQGLHSIIIFVTGYREYMPAAFDVQAFHYLLKPIDKVKFSRVLENACLEVRYMQGQKEDYVLLKLNGSAGDMRSRRKVSLQDIYFIESNNKNVIIHTTEGTYEVQGKMDEFEQTLGTAFYRCHRCYLVNMAKISAYSPEGIQVTNGEMVMLANKKYAAFVKAYLHYAKGGGIVNV
ncbi:LytR/AlgR family response regulator transcription factor [Selenomonas ruminantium]|uniref:LytR/AlgR family response regulator transcription factor n=1 Tax=Selenomonas ruminantium TaxID=971 RepID=UPI000417FEE1|nr:LytTR family DNA-binding domain-containing protein [Selenomonas ruminantium]